MEKVYVDHAHCCGCGGCAEVCPKHAISMECDPYGFIYPKIDINKCIDCGICKKSCAFHALDAEIKSKCYAAVNTNEEELMQSTSGGVFAGIASAFLKDGFVCGAGSFFEAGNLEVKHVSIEHESDLKILQGSKYVQSHMWYCVPSLREVLKSGKKVLFSGTPCQVACIKSIFNKYVGKQLYTIDIICHGVPSQKMLNEYLHGFQEENKIELVNFDFRNKKYGWGREGLAVGTGTDDEEPKQIKISPENSSYYKFFMEGEFCRESCYHCPYACANRVGDLTIGDYWGVERYDPQLLRENGGELETHKGISCLLVNTDAGQELLDVYGQAIKCFPISIENIMKINTQLRKPAEHSQLREKLLRKFAKEGYSGIEEMYGKIRFKSNIKMGVKKVIPKRLWYACKKIAKGS